MNVLISNEGKHEPAGHHYMVVDGHGLLVDLSGVSGQLLDPTITRVTWGLQRDGVEMKPGGTIVRQDGHKQVFWEAKLLEPYLEAWRAKRDELLGGA